MSILDWVQALEFGVSAGVVAIIFDAILQPRPRKAKPEPEPVEVQLPKAA